MNLTEKCIVQYLAQLKVNLLEAHHTSVNMAWGECQTKVDYAKLYYIISGSGFINIDGECYYPKQGDVIYIPEGCLLSFGVQDLQPYRKYWCHFNAHIGTTPLSQIIDFPLLLHPEDGAAFVEHFEALCEASHAKESLAPILSNSILMKIIYVFLRSMHTDAIHLKNQVADMKVNQLLIYMEQSIHKKLTISDLVAIANLHPNYLIRYFKSAFGVSPIAYFNRMKIEKAKELLVIDNEPIKNIASSLGYSSAYYFSSAFKNQTGFTPTDYRKNVNQGPFD